MANDGFNAKPRPVTGPSQGAIDPAEPPKRRSRADKAIGALGGADEFSISGTRPPGAPVAIKTPARTDTFPNHLAAPTRQQNLFLRLYAKIFR